MKILHCKFHILEFSFNKSCELGMNLGEQVVLQLYEKHHPALPSHKLDEYVDYSGLSVQVSEQREAHV